MEMLYEREENLLKTNQSRPRSLILHSGFITGLLRECRENDYKSDYKYGENRYSNRWWKRGINLFEVDRIFIPVNTKNTHWTLLVLHMQEKEVHYYDSRPLDQTRLEVLFDSMKRWLVDEARKYANNENYDNSEWKLVVDDCPEQTNWYDCGVFTIMNADFLMDNLPLDFKEEEMDGFREKIATDILRGSLRYSDC